MCGIAGFIDLATQTPREALERRGRRMADALRHRGPDDGGVWADEAAGVALAHQRLAIVDLSPAGHQPMLSACGRYVLAFNGEIYNFRQLRQQLDAELPQPIDWRGHCDTEVLLAGIAHWGLAAALRQTVGMFALALWDRQTRTLMLARDRLGEKPLYYGLNGTRFMFASELKALRTLPDFEAGLHRDALPLYLRHRYIPAPYSIYRAIYKLWPGCILTFQGQPHIEPFPSDAEDEQSASACQPMPYWSLARATQHGYDHPFAGTEEDAVDELERLLRSTVQAQMLADVPLGAFLSGGIDSSTIAALMQAQSALPVRTFSIGFHDTERNEAPYASAVAAHLGTQHTEYYVTEQDALDVIPRLPQIYDEPFADASQIPTFLLSRMTRQAVTVSLSGDGGDELFCGYWRYVLGEQVWQRMHRLPAGLRMLLSRTALRVPVPWLNAGFSIFTPFLRHLDKVGRSIGDNVHTMARLFGSRDMRDFYRTAFSHWQRPLALVRGAADAELPDAFTRRDLVPAAPSLLRHMMLVDTCGYLPDDILVKVDRAAMVVSLETRIPLLDHRVVEFALSLPVDMNYHHRIGKRVLRRVLNRYVPRALVERPKMGFGVPMARWLRGPLREWAEDLLDEGRLRRDGLFHPEPIRRRWREHLAGRYSRHYELWDVLMFQAWLHS